MTSLGGTQTTEAQQAYDQFWPKVTDEIRNMSIADLKHQELPLARIKKIMKLDEDVKMISAEAPVLFAKAAEMFIHELTMRAWIHTEDNKRRTLQRNDIAMAITKYDQFDFLIDIVPRDDIKPTTKREEASVRMVPDQVSYYFQLAQQHQQALQSSNNPAQATASQSTSQQQQQQQPQAQPQQPQQQQQQQSQQHQQQHQQQAQQQSQQQVVQAGAAGGVQTITVNNQQASNQPQQPQIIQLQPQQMTSAVSPPPGGIQIVQQIIGPNGEIQQIPIQLNTQQLQVIRAQMMGGGGAQPIVIQTAPIQAQLPVSQNTGQTIQLQGGQQVYIQQE